MKKENPKVKANQSKINKYMAEYRKKMTMAVGEKSMSAFNELISEANLLLGKANDLTKKNKFILQGKPENGYAEEGGDYNFLID